MKKLTKKFVAIFIALLVVSTIFSSVLITRAATDENIAYEFDIQSYSNVSRITNGRYRGTTNNDSAWKVNLKTSDEATKCGTEFCIALNNGKLCSEWYLVEKGSGSHYYAANDNGDAVTVYLQARDNNNSYKEYHITGFWDEETGMTPD